MGVIVAHSHVADGSMLNRDDFADPSVFMHRSAWLAKQGIHPHTTYRVSLDFEGDDFCRYREVSTHDTPVDADDSSNATADALVTTRKGEALFLPVADCAAMVLYDEANGVLMLSHLGRHSAEQHGARRSVEYLHSMYGSDQSALQVWVSAAVGKDSYQLYKLNNKGLKEALLEQLLEAGVSRDHIHDTPDDTATHPEYFSHSEFLKGRTEKKGRHATVAVMTDASE